MNKSWFYIRALLKSPINHLAILLIICAGVVLSFPYGMRSVEIAALIAVGVETIAILLIPDLPAFRKFVDTNSGNGINTTSFSASPTVQTANSTTPIPPPSGGAGKQIPPTVTAPITVQSIVTSAPIALPVPVPVSLPLSSTLNNGAFTVEISAPDRLINKAAFKLEIIALMLSPKGKVKNDADVICASNALSPCHSVALEQDQHYNGLIRVFVKTELLPTKVQKIVFVLALRQQIKSSVQFGDLSHISISSKNPLNPREDVCIDLEDDYSKDTAMIFGELSRDGTNWRFTTIGKPLMTEINIELKTFGVEKLIL